MQTHNDQVSRSAMKTPRVREGKTLLTDTNTIGGYTN